jgi:hypothetical protein
MPTARKLAVMAKIQAHLAQGSEPVSGRMEDARPVGSDLAVHAMAAGRARSGERRRAEEVIIAGRMGGWREKPRGQSLLRYYRMKVS